jgi:hypothetical protein
VKNGLPFTLMQKPLLALACGFIWIGVATADPSLTIYNEDFAVVRDTVPLDLKQGVNDVSFTDTTAHLEPDSVILRDPTGKLDLQILEQNYRNDPITQDLLLSLNEGQTIDFLNQQPGKPDQIVQGKIVRSGYVAPSQTYDENGNLIQQNPGSSQPVIDVNGKLQFTLPGLPLFPSLGTDTILKPTLTWKLQASAAAKLDAELAYITQGMSWEADYNVVAAADSDVLDIIGWITMTNKSGKSFKNGAIKLMAGDVNKIQTNQMMLRSMNAVSMPTGMSAPQVTEKAFEDFHLYSLPRPTDLKDGETKQVEFIHAAGVHSQRIYVYDGAQIDWNQWTNNPIGRRQSEEFGTVSSKKVSIVREFKNSTENHLGIPLPKGRLRFYKKDDQALEFTGENIIDHTPTDETVKVYTGNAFDLVGERTRTNFKIDSTNNSADESFSLKLTNHKKEPVEIRAVEHLYRWTNWEITAKSDTFLKTNAQEIEFRIQLKPNEEKTVTYSVHYSW